MCSSVFVFILGIRRCSALSGQTFGWKQVWCMAYYFIGLFASLPTWTFHTQFYSLVCVSAYSLRLHFVLVSSCYLYWSLTLKWMLSVGWVYRLKLPVTTGPLAVLCTALQWSKALCHHYALFVLHSRSKSIFLSDGKGSDIWQHFRSRQCDWDDSKCERTRPCGSFCSRW